MASKRCLPISTYRLDCASEARQAAAARESMRIRSNVRMLYFRVQTMLRQRRRKQKRCLEISAPFNLTREPIVLPGVSEDEISILKEKAAASCIGVAETMPRSPSAVLLSPMRSPAPACLPSSATVPSRMGMA